MTLRVLNLSSIKHLKIDGPGVSCAFKGRACGGYTNGFGGFDQHHPWPKEMGGAEKQDFLNLCPNHHRRQHALVRALVERDGRLPAAISKKFGRPESTVARRAYHLWVDAGRPTIKGWPCLAAAA